MIKKKILPIFVIAAVLFTGIFTNFEIASAYTEKFTDINGHWGEDIINEAAGLGIVGGYPEGYFLPNNLMKREEFFKLITNVLTAVPDTTNTTINFKDIDPTEWYVPTVKIAVAAGITSGYEDGTFGIGRMISRQEAAKVVASVISTNNLDTTKNASIAKDVELIGEWALPYVNIMFQKGYMKGDTNGNFRPTNALTRAEAATLLLSVKKAETVIAGPSKTSIVGTTTSSAVTTTSSAVTTTSSAVTTPTEAGGCQKVHSVTEGAFTLGKGTSKDPYQIQTEAQLNHIREHLGEGAYYILNNDIVVKSDFATQVPNAATGETNWSEGNFVPIGDKDNPFRGTLYGDGHSISGLTISGIARGQSEGVDYVGLFGHLATSGSIEGLTIDGSTINGYLYTGGVVGYNDGEITNCGLGSDAKVNGAIYTGGIAGYTTTTLISNVNRGTVVGTNTNTGGIVGSANLEGDAVKKCINKGSVSGKIKTGGIIGYLAATSMTVNIESCSNAGKVYSTADYAGGIAGQVDGSSYIVYIKDCYNTGELAGDGVNGGIVGYAKGNISKLMNCYNTGEIKGIGAGGIVGNNEGNIETCYNTGQIASNSEAGGIVAYQNTGEGCITNCYNDGVVAANYNAGGIAGLSRDKIYNSYNSGEVIATNTVGGLVGLNYAPIQRSYNVGKVSGNRGIGSLTGINRASLTDCFWLIGTCDTDIGYENSGSSKSIVMGFSKEQLSGQLKIKLGNGYQLLTNYLNDQEGSKVWDYTYKMLEAASDENSLVISDGGGIVPPIAIPTTDEKGNVINPSDLISEYIYPELIDIERK